MQQAAEPISAELIDGVKSLVEHPRQAGFGLQGHTRSFPRFRIPSIEPVLERSDTRLRYFNAYGRDPAAVEFNVGLMRGLEYYTGFLFEIYAKARPNRPCLRRRRYDNLLEGLGADTSIPAVGFGIGLDRLLLVLQNKEAHAADERRAPDALVVVAGKTRYETASVSALRCARQAGR